jgi:uncharacterized protein YbjT (DUF2867 family)
VKIIVIGGTGLVGSKVVAKLRASGLEAVAASPDSGVNTITGEGLAEVLTGASVVVDVSNSPSFEDAAVLAFFETSTRNLLAAESEAGVRHHVALSVVGTERLPASGYFRAKQAQEKLIRESPIPYSIVHATQFFEFAKGIADAATDGDTVRVAPVTIQPMAAEDVANAVASVAVGEPVNGTIEIAGPEQFRLDEFIRRGLVARRDPREVIADPRARYFGAELDDRTLVPADGARLATTRFQDWLSVSTPSASLRTHVVSASLLLVVALAAGCGTAGAEIADTAAALPSAVVGVAGNCPADAWPMRPATAGAMVNRNGDGYVCTRQIRSIAGDTLRLMVDNDAATTDSERVEPEMYVGM